IQLVDKPKHITMAYDSDLRPVFIDERDLTRTWQCVDSSDLTHKCCRNPRVIMHRSQQVILSRKKRKVARKRTQILTFCAALIWSEYHAIVVNVWESGTPLMEASTRQIRNLQNKGGL